MKLKIERLIHGGLGLARVQGKTIFVPTVIPGETVLAELTQEKPSYASARLVKVIEPSPFRISPECQHFPACGACQLAHISYPHQLHLKKEILCETLIRIGKFDPAEKLENPLPSPAPWKYRSRLRFHIISGRLGFKAFQESRIIPIDDCLLARDELRATLPALKKLARELAEKEDFSLELSLNPETGQAFALVSAREKSAYLFQQGKFGKISPDRKNRLQLLSFVQPNPDQNAKMIETVSALAESVGAKTCLELFAGSGNLTFALAKKSGKVVAVEINRHAVELGNLRRRELQADNVQFLSQTAESYLNYATKSSQKYDLVVLDPPRAGAKREIQKIILLQPKAIIYASCEPSTLARDLRTLLNAGCQLIKIIPLDLFPQTFHIETITLLRLGPGLYS